MRRRSENRKKACSGEADMAFFETLLLPHCSCTPAMQRARRKTAQGLAEALSADPSTSGSQWQPSGPSDLDESLGSEQDEQPRRAVPISAELPEQANGFLAQLASFFASHGRTQLLVSPTSAVQPAAGGAPHHITLVPSHDAHAHIPISRFAGSPLQPHPAGCCQAVAPGQRAGGI